MGVDPLLVNINDVRAYGPAVLNDELLMGPIPAGSPVPSGAASFGYTDASQLNTTVNVGSQLPGSFLKKPHKILRVSLNSSRGDALRYDSGEGDLITWEYPPLLIDEPGTMFWCVWADDNGGTHCQDAVPGAVNPSLIAMVSIDAPDAPEIPFGPGFVLSGVPFTKLYIRNTAQTGGRLILFIATDAPVDRVDAAVV